MKAARAMSQVSPHDAQQVATLAEPLGYASPAPARPRALTIAAVCGLVVAMASGWLSLAGATCGHILPPNTMPTMLRPALDATVRAVPFAYPVLTPDNIL